MLILTRHFALVGLPWTGIRAIGRAAASCAPEDWELDLRADLPLASIAAALPQGLPTFTVVSHPVAWYADLWRHRAQPIARQFRLEFGQDLAAFVAGPGAGLLSAASARLSNVAPRDVVAVRVEHFVPDIRRAVRQHYEIPRQIMPTFRAVQDEMAERPLPADLRATIGDAVRAGDPLFERLGYSTSVDRCGEIAES